MQKYLLTAFFAVLITVSCASGDPGDTDLSIYVDDDPGVCDENDFPPMNDGITEALGVGGCPPGMVPIPSDPNTCIDRYEAALVEITATGEKAWSPYRNPVTTQVKAISASGAIPQGYINQTQAAAACAEAGKRLCTDIEWLAACRGSAVTTYPYGPTHIAGNCNDSRATHPVIEYFGSSESWVWDEIDHPCINQLADSLDPTGANIGCVSEGGIYDMVGNLHEWTADPAGTFRGGFYVDTTINGNGCLYATMAHNVSHSDYSTGFRCCSDL